MTGPDPDRYRDDDPTRTQRRPRITAAIPVPGTVLDHPRPVGAGPADDVPHDRDLGGGRPAVAPDPLWQVLARGVGELLVTAGLVVLLFVVYEVYVTDLFNDRRQDQLTEQIHQQWTQQPVVAQSAAPVEPAVGEPMAVLHIPRLGADYRRVVLQGTSEDQLAQGPGHYVGTAMPGQPGNLAIAGHRVGKGSPFLDLDEMQPGDPIVVETADSWFVYRVLAHDAGGIPGLQVVAPTDVGVIAPTPDAPGTAASGSYLTLTTCHPEYSARQRLIVHAVLDGSAVSKADLPDGPPDLQGD